VFEGCVSFRLGKIGSLEGEIGSFEENLSFGPGKSFVFGKINFWENQI
jgi:hypothetical protein